MRAKGNQFKNKRVLIEAIHKRKAETIKAKTLEDQTEARKNKARVAKEKKEKRAAAALAEKDAQ